MTKTREFFDAKAAGLACGDGVSALQRSPGFLVLARQMARHLLSLVTVLIHRATKTVGHAVRGVLTPFSFAVGRIDICDVNQSGKGF